MTPFNLDLKDQKTNTMELGQMKVSTRWQRSRKRRQNLLSQSSSRAKWLYCLTWRVRLEAKNFGGRHKKWSILKCFFLLIFSAWKVCLLPILCLPTYVRVLHCCCIKAGPMFSLGSEWSSIQTCRSAPAGLPPRLCPSDLSLHESLLSYGAHKIRNDR